MLERLKRILYGLNIVKWLVSALELVIEWRINVCLLSINFSAQSGCRISVEQNYGVEWAWAFRGNLGYFSILLSEFLTSTDLFISLENNTQFISCHREENTLLAVVNLFPVRLNRSAGLEVSCWKSLQVWGGEVVCFVRFLTLALWGL